MGVEREPYTGRQGTGGPILIPDTPCSTARSDYFYFCFCNISTDVATETLVGSRPKYSLLLHSSLFCQVCLPFSEQCDHCHRWLLPCLLPRIIQEFTLPA